MPTDDFSKALVLMLADYLCKFPEASDTLEGIAGWWLRPDLGVPQATLLQGLEQALEWMEQNGLIERVYATDGRVRFRRTDSEGGLDVRVEAALVAQQRLTGDGRD